MTHNNDASTLNTTVVKSYTVGDVFQITEAHKRTGWIGAFVMATEIKPWGIMGFVSHVATHDEQQRAYIRLHYEEIEYIGRAALIPIEYIGRAALIPQDEIVLR